MRIVMLSDNHGYYDGIDVPAGDVLIHSGDYSGMSTIQELITFNLWIGKLPHVCKFFIPGNHDRIWETDQSFAKGLLPNAVTLIDQEFEWKGIKFYGTPYQPFFYDWAFNVADDAKRAMIFEKIPSTTNVLITHCPPHKLLDVNDVGEHCGDLMLKRKISTLRALKLHVYGHIHDGAGTAFSAPVTYVNCSVTDDKYNLVRQPQVFDL